MSVYIASGEGPGDQVGSNQGWGDFGHWVETLSAEDYPDLCHLWDHGWAEPASAVRDQLAAARAASPPGDPTVAATCDLVAATLGDCEADAPAVVTSGFADDATDADPKGGPA